MNEFFHLAQFIIRKISSTDRQFERQYASYFTWNESYYMMRGNARIY